jgi:hypothetical protein
LVQGRKMRWEKGSTHDVLHALNADLTAAREGKI